MTADVPLGPVRSLLEGIDHTYGTTACIETVEDVVRAV